MIFQEPIRVVHRRGRRSGGSQQKLFGEAALWELWRDIFKKNCRIPALSGSGNNPRTDNPILLFFQILKRLGFIIKVLFKESFFKAI